MSFREELVHLYDGDVFGHPVDAQLILVRLDLVRRRLSGRNVEHVPEV